MLKCVIFLVILVAVLAKHECHHDKKMDPSSLQKIQPNKEAFDDKGRMLAGTYSPIRIYTDFSQLTAGSSYVREYIKNQVIASAVAYYQSVLKVVPYAGLLQTTQSCGGLAAPSQLRSPGIAADLVILVTAGAASSTESYLAYASPCALSAVNNRTIYGMINYNLNQLSTKTNIDLEENLITTLHELSHILGFSSSLYPYFVDPNTNAPVTALGSTTVQGKTVYYLGLEPLRTNVRNFFGCSDLEGAYLENEGDSGSAKSHLERKTFSNELMTASAISDAVVSQFALGVLEITGWYQVSYTNAIERFTYGQGKGCNFVRQSCMIGTAAAYTPEFCSPLQSQGCTYTGRNVGVCGTTSAGTPRSVDSSYNYWGNNTAILDSFANNCPYYLGYPNLDCMQPSDAANAILSEEKYGLNSRCMSGTLSDTNSPNARTGFCFPITCALSGSTYSLTVTVGSRQISCTSAGSVTVPGLSGQLECPDPTAYCAKANPQYCKRGCSGRGSCVNNQCVCPIGWGGMDCALRYYVDGCSRCSGNSAGSSCFGNSCSCNPATGGCPAKSALIGQGDNGIQRDGEQGASSGTHLKLSLGAILVLAMMFFA